MGRVVIALYRPRQGCAPRLRDVLREHVPLLRAEGLATARPAVHLLAHDGTVIEIFEWVSEQASADAHHNAAVQALWARFDQVAEFVSLADLPEAHRAFSHFDPLDL
jgi:hypothetical protein